MSSEQTPTLELQGVYRSFKQGTQKLEVLRGVDLEIKKGEIVALVGPSGSGKTTAFNCITRAYESTHGPDFFKGRGIVRNHPQGKKKKPVDFSRDYATIRLYPQWSIPGGFPRGKAGAKSFGKGVFADEKACLFGPGPVRDGGGFQRLRRQV